METVSDGFENAPRQSSLNELWQRCLTDLRLRWAMLAKTC
jgi:hypothetical protein